MKNLFLRLYLLLLVAFLGIGWGIDQFIDSYSAGRQITTDIDIHKGTFFLVEKELHRLPASEREAFLKSIAPSFGFAVALNRLDALRLSTKQRQHLAQGGIVSAYDDHQGVSWFYQQFAKNDVIVIGPVHYEPRTSTAWSVLFFLIIALVAYIWVWPITQGLRELTRAASAFGKGDFSVRAKIGPAALQELSIRFNAMAERIQRLVESHKELSHGVSHELRTPIARLRFAMEMVREVDDQGLRSKYLDTMDTNIEELDGLVDELLVYARFDREEPKLELQTVDLAEVLGAQVERFVETEPELSIEFDSPQPLLCTVDKAALTRVVDNLVRNAVRYAQSRIKVSCTETPQLVCITVDDDGQGIPEHSREELFKPFVRLDQSRDRQSGGIGLGLAIVKRLVELHHGGVRAAANADGGARFIIELPRLSEH